MEPFCYNERCMFHNVDVEPDKMILQLESDNDTPIILADTHEKGYLMRAALQQHGKVKAKFCETCMNAINQVHEIRNQRI